MGYDTQLTIRLHGQPDIKTSEEIEKKIRECGHIIYHGTDVGNNPAIFAEIGHYYSILEQTLFKKLSKRFPDIVIEVSGDGEDSPDYWIARYQNGVEVTSKGIVAYEPFTKIALPEDVENLNEIADFSKEELEMLSIVFHCYKDYNRGEKDRILPAMALEKKLISLTNGKYTPDTTYDIK